MDTELLRTFIEVSKTRHFGRAAQACHITQPALSNALRALEKEFGVVVVRRGRSFEGFTPEGERVLAHVAQAWSVPTCWLHLHGLDGVQRNRVPW
jgi:DNA-binding transcriptional LysR family regulator